MNELRNGYDEVLINDLISKTKEVAINAGGKIIEAFATDFTADFKEDHRDLVTKYDVMTEEYLVENLGVLLPGCRFITEENTTGANYQKDSIEKQYIWIIDPIDGTTNFVKFKENFAISIALYYDTEPVFGLVYDVMKDDIYLGITGRGAYLNHNPLELKNKNVTVKEAIIDFSLKSLNHFKRKENIDLERLSKEVLGHRARGCASLIICSLATGKADAYISGKLMIWDYAAAAILLKEVGGGYQYYLQDGIDPLHLTPVQFFAYNNRSIFDEIDRIVGTK